MTKTPIAEAAVKEQWKSVPGYKGIYEVSDLGRVRSLDRVTNHGRRRKGRILSICEKSRYRMTVLAAGGTNTTFRISRLVCLLFNGFPTCGMEVNHKNGNKHDDRAENLEWCSKAENQIHACRTGLRKLGEESYQAKLTNKQVQEIRAKYARGITSHAKLAYAYGVSRSAICAILSKKNWKYIA